MADESGVHAGVGRKRVAGADGHGVSGLLARIHEHKIVQWALGYVAAAIAIAHGQEMLAHAFGWSPAIGRWLLATLLAGFPIVLTVAWYHGHMRLARITRGEIVIGSILTLLGAGLMVLLLRSAPHAAGGTGAGAAAAPATQSGPYAARAAPSAAKPRIAVLPFENLSPDPGNAFFTDGVHEEILTALANGVPGLEVISGTTMATYRGKAVAVQTLAHDLGCSYVLEGSVRREADDVRLTVQLIDARTDSHIWAHSYERKVLNAMALESEVARDVATRLSQKLAAAEPAQRATSPAAYDLYLRARLAESDARRSGTLDGYRDAEQLLGQALALDPGFVRAYLERMSLGVQRFLFNFSSPEEVLPPAHADLAAAQRLAPADPVVTGFAGVMAYAELDYAQALKLFDGAEAAGLADAELLDWKDRLLFAMGSYAEAVALGRRLAELDPRNDAAQDRLLSMLMEMHEYEDALGVVDAAIARGQSVADWQERRAMVLYYAAGNLEPRRALYAPILKQPWRTVQDVDDHIAAAYEQLFLEHHFRELRALLQSAPVDDWRCTYVDWPLYRVGRTPIAAALGWTDLLLGDRVQAKADGRKILDYLAAHPETRFNRWYRGLLTAMAQLFKGDAAQANRTAAQAVALTQAEPDIGDRMNAYVWSTKILAWGDEASRAEAVQRLTGLSTSVPGLWPGEIVGDPIYSMPLAGRADFEALRARLSARMRASGLR